MAHSLKVTSPAPRDVWHTLMNVDPESVPYQSPAWLDSLCALGKYEDASRLYETDDGRKILLPFVRRKMRSILSAEGLVTSDELRADDVRAVFADLVQLPFMRVVIRPNPRTGRPWAAGAPPGVLALTRLAHVLDLQGGFQEVWSKRFSKTTRSRIRKAERLGVTVERDTTGQLLPVFYDLLLRSFDRWAVMQHEPRFLTRLRGKARDPLRKFRAIVDTFGPACSIWIARVDGKPAAGSFVLQGGNVNNSRGAMDKDVAASSGAADLLMKLTIEEACRSGCRYYHMGETHSPSLAHFKARFGAEPYAFAEYRLEKMPLTSLDAAMRGLVKRAVGSGRGGIR